MVVSALALPFTRVAFARRAATRAFRANAHVQWRAASSAAVRTAAAMTSGPTVKPEWHLKVPYDQKDDAKARTPQRPIPQAMGARWVQDAKMWVAPDGQADLLERWGPDNKSVQRPQDSQRKPAPVPQKHPAAGGGDYKAVNVAGGAPYGGVDKFGPPVEFERAWLLDVPYADKDRAKGMGAKWVQAESRWVAPNGQADLLAIWARVRVSACPQHYSRRNSTYQALHCSSYGGPKSPEAAPKPPTRAPAGTQPPPQAPPQAPPPPRVLAPQAAAQPAAAQQQRSASPAPAPPPAPPAPAPAGLPPKVHVPHAATAKPPYGNNKGAGGGEGTRVYLGFPPAYKDEVKEGGGKWDSVAYGWYVEDASHPLAVRFPRTYLAVPIEEKDIVKSGGAKWDPAVKGWWVDSPTHPLATQYPRVYIDVSLAEKEAAKTGGAKWDPIARRWYVGSTDHPLAKAYGPISTFATEDRTFGGPLGMEVIPRGYWARSVRTLVTEENFRRIQRTVLGRTDCCELCGAAARGRKLEVHSRWDVNGIACRIRLARLLAACPNCMDVVNLYKAQKQGRLEDAVAHVCSVRSWTDEEYAEHVQGVSAKVGKMEPWRSPETGETGWVIDAALLTESGVPLDPNAESRAAERRQMFIERQEREALLDEFAGN